MMTKAIFRILFFNACLLETTYAADGNCPSPAACEEAAWRITDPMIGAINGKNGVFALSRIPDPVASIFIFKNGLKLREDIDYKFLARQVVLIGASIPQPGDVLTAMYTVAPRIAAPARNSAASTYHFDSAGNDLAAIALREALIEEVKAAGESKASVPALSDLRSLRMLSSFPKEAATRAKRNITTMSGFDGLGDNSGVLPSTGQNAKLTNSISEPGSPEWNAPRSLRLLDQHLAESGGKSRSQGSKKKPKFQ
jgi:hypothetical protein